MPSQAPKSAVLDLRRRRAHFRSWHRGMREVDLILGTFADNEIGRLDDTLLAQYEALMEEPDADVLKWVTGELPVPTQHDNAVFKLILSYRGHFTATKR